jgi:hypothetical protein
MAQSTGVMGDFSLGVAGVDLSTYTYRGVYLDTSLSGEAGSPWVQLSDTSHRPFGVLQNKPKLNEACALRVIGTTKLVVDAVAAVSNIVPGDKLKANATGMGIKASTDGDEVFAIAMEPATATGSIIEALLVNRQA